jgi:protein subunit release factor B
MKYALSKERGQTMPHEKTDQELLAECTVETHRSSGPGGQNVNVRDTAVRLRHLPSGLVVTCQRERSQLRNKQIALQELRSRLEERQRPRKHRRWTPVPKRVRARIRDSKQHRSLKKASRRKPKLGD